GLQGHAEPNQNPQSSAAQARSSCAVARRVLPARRFSSRSHCTTNGLAAARKYRPLTTDQGLRTKEQAAGAAQPPSEARTGPASPGCSVCAPGAMAFSLYRRPTAQAFERSLSCSEPFLGTPGVEDGGHRRCERACTWRLWSPVAS